MSSEEESGFYDHDGEDLLEAMPDCTFKRALTIAHEREIRDGGAVIRELVGHLFPPELQGPDEGGEDDPLSTLIEDVFHAGAHHSLETIGRMAAQGTMGPMAPLCFLLSVAFGEGMVYGSIAQATYEQETREQFGELPTTTESND